MAWPAIGAPFSRQMSDPTYEPITSQLVDRRHTSLGQLLLYFVPNREGESSGRDVLPSSGPALQEKERFVSRT